MFNNNCFNKDNLFVIGFQHTETYMLLALLTQLSFKIDLRPRGVSTFFTC